MTCRQLPYRRLEAAHPKDIVLLGGESAWHFISTLDITGTEQDDDIDFLGLDDTDAPSLRDEDKMIDEVLALLDGSSVDELQGGFLLVPSAPAEPSESGSDESAESQPADADDEIDLDVALVPNTDEEKAMLEELGLVLTQKAGGNVWNTYARRVFGSEHGVDTLGHIETLVSSSGISLKACCHKHPKGCICLVRATNQYFQKYRLVLRFLSEAGNMGEAEHLHFGETLRNSVQ